MGVEIASVDALLSRWGRWALRCESNALGFASSSILAGGCDGDAFDSAVPRGVADGDMEAVDGAVKRLPSVLRMAVIEVYQHGSGQSVRKVAVRMGVANHTLTKYIAEAQRKIALDISVPCSQNTLQSANGGSCPGKNQPVTA